MNIIAAPASKIAVFMAFARARSSMLVLMGASTVRSPVFHGAGLSSGFTNFNVRGFCIVTLTFAVAFAASGLECGPPARATAGTR
jgi:hypothetical protein